MKVLGLKNKIYVFLNIEKTFIDLLHFWFPPFFYFYPDYFSLFLIVLAKLRIDKHCILKCFYFCLNKKKKTDLSSFLFFAYSSSNISHVLSFKEIICLQDKQSCLLLRSFPLEQFPYHNLGFCKVGFTTFHLFCRQKSSSLLHLQVTFNSHLQSWFRRHHVAMSCLAASTFRIAYSAEASQLLAAWTFLWLFASDFPWCLNTTIDKKGGTEYIKDCHDYRGIARATHFIIWQSFFFI